MSLLQVKRLKLKVSKELTLALRMATQSLNQLKDLQSRVESAISSVLALESRTEEVAKLSRVTPKEGPRGPVGEAGAAGKDGVDGTDGEQGPMGPMPKHQISGDRIRFEIEEGVWGNWMDLGGSTGGGGGGIDQARYQINTFTTDTQLRDNHSTVLVDASAGNVTVTLPAAKSLVGRVYTIKKIDVSTNAVIISGYGGNQTIDGETTQTIQFQWTSLRLQSDGNNWVIL